MKLENGYKLIYEVIENGVREFRASKTGAPTENDYVLTSNKIGENKLVYQYANKFYGTGDNVVPTYNADGTPADTALITDEAYAEVFIAKEAVEVEPSNEPTPHNETNNETPEEVEEPDAGEGESMIEE